MVFAGAAADQPRFSQNLPAAWSSIFCSVVVEVVEVVKVVVVVGE